MSKIALITFRCDDAERLRPLPSRETEIETLQTFLLEHLESQESGSLYVSGQPGTGKTASISYILQSPKVFVFTNHTRQSGLLDN